MSTHHVWAIGLAVYVIGVVAILEIAGALRRRARRRNAIRRHPARAEVIAHPTIRRIPRAQFFDQDQPDPTA